MVISCPVCSGSLHPESSGSVMWECEDCGSIINHSQAAKRAIGKLSDVVKRKKVGMIGVDAGLCWVGDPCYIHPDLDEKKPSLPKEFGQTWSEFCDILWKKSPPDKPTVAQFNYDLGHKGLGVCVSTGYGDGTYPVYIEMIKDEQWGERIKSLTVVFIEDEEKSSKLMSKIANKKKG